MSQTILWQLPGFGAVEFMGSNKCATPPAETLIALCQWHVGSALSTAACGPSDQPILRRHRCYKVPYACWGHLQPSCISTAACGAINLSVPTQPTIINTTERHMLEKHACCLHAFMETIERCGCIYWAHMTCSSSASGHLLKTPTRSKDCIRLAFSIEAFFLHASLQQLVACPDQGQFPNNNFQMMHTPVAHPKERQLK